MAVFEEITQKIKEAKDIMVLTGAGMSTESGIPDFRSKEGLYQYAPSDILSREFFSKNPLIFYEFIQQKLFLPHLKPNKGHEILAKWESAGKVSEVITQNIDGLHQKAGSKHVIEFHGSLKTATCMNPSCGQHYELEQVFQRKAFQPNYWECNCGHLIKPDIVLFGDVGTQMKDSIIFDIRERIFGCDLLLVLGTSLEVYPFNNFVRFRNEEVPTVIINKGTTAFDNRKNVFVLKESIGDVLKKLDKKMNQ